MKGSFCALLDASVLYPVSLRNLLMCLTLNGLFQARWSRQIHEEWITAVLRDRPDLSADKLHRVRDAMNAQAEDCIVTGHESLIDSLTLPDPDDRHVLAAAIVAGADVIVTRAAKGEIRLTCAGVEMVAITATVEEPATITVDEPVVLGKRYEDAETGLELLCTKAGGGPLECDGRGLVIVTPKLMPATD